MYKYIQYYVVSKWANMKIKTYKDRVGNYAPIKTCNNSNIPPPGHNDQIPHPKWKNEVQMPCIAQLSGGQMSHCNVRVKSNRDQPPRATPGQFDLTLPLYRREFDGPAGHLTTWQQLAQQLVFPKNMCTF
jgi:hypothetical protein